MKHVNTCGALIGSQCEVGAKKELQNRRYERTVSLRSDRQSGILKFPHCHDRKLSEVRNAVRWSGTVPFRHASRKRGDKWDTQRTCTTTFQLKQSGNAVAAGWTQVRIRQAVRSGSYFGFPCQGPRRTAPHPQHLFRTRSEPYFSGEVDWRTWPYERVCCV